MRGLELIQAFASLPGRARNNKPRVYVHIYIYTRIYVYTHIRIYIYIYTHTFDGLMRT